MEKQSTRKFLKLIVALVALFLLGASALMLASCNKDEHQHSYTSSVTTPATCSNPGVETFTCSCGYAYTQIIPATGDHDWQVLQVYPNSCESDGYTVYECSVCHEQKQGDWTAKRDHKYEAVETVEATCTTDGYQIMQCSYCGDRYTDDQYSAEHKATGHKWIVNESPADPADLTDAEGWKVVKAADCLNAAQLQRKCSVCGETEEKVGAPALGHYVTGMDENTTLEEALGKDKHYLCLPDTTLVDAEGNKFYAFECEREDCPVNVVVDARGTEKHYIKAIDHKMKLDTTASADGKKYVAATCEKEGWDVYKCSVCGTTEGEVTEKLGHSYNTLQSDGKTDVVVCIEDKGINTLAKYLDFMKATVGAATFYKNQTAYSTAWTNAKDDPDNAAAVDAVAGTFAISQVCTRCGTPTAALGHKYIIVKYAEGSFTEYEKDEDGALVDYSDEVTVTAMNCRYVQLCSGCGDVAKRGAHQNVSAATCRSGGICPDCGRQVTAQLSHIYSNISEFVSADGKAVANASTKSFAGTTISYQAAYDAWKKVSATETWMVPVSGDCDSASTDVTVCVQCLVDAAKGTEVTWNQATEAPQTGIPGNAVSNTNAYVITNEFSHDYQPTYFALDAADTTAANIPYADTSCRVGFKVAYICTKCGDVFKNVPVANDPDTKPEKGDEKNDSETNEAKDNKLPDAGLPQVYTDANGFVIDSTKVNATVDFQEKELAEALAAVIDNKRQHLLYVVAGYDKTSGYVAPTCVAVGQVPYTCLHCGTIVVLSAGADDTNKPDDVNNVQNTYDYATQAQVDEVLGADANVTIIAPEAIQGDKNDITDFEKIDPNNHAGKVYACGEHCDHKNVLGAADCGNNTANKTDHSAVTVTYQLKADLKGYYSNYTVKIAVVGTEPKSDDPDLANDFNNYIEKFLDGTTVAKCGDNKYTAPSRTEWTKGSTGKYLVLVDEDDKAYQFIGNDDKLTFYTEDGLTDAGKIPDIDADTIKVNSNDIFFMSFPTTGEGVKLPVAAPVTASDEPSLKLALNNNAPDTVTENGKQIKVLTVELAGNIEVTEIPQTTQTVNRVVYDLNGHTLKTAQKSSFSATDDVVFQNGSIEFSNVMLNDNGTTDTSDDYPDKAGASMALGEVGKLTLDNVTFTAAGSGLFVATNANADPDTGETDNYLTIKDSTLVIKGYFGVGTNATDSSAIVGSPKVTIEKSTITMNPDQYNVGGKGNNKDNTALFINVPSNVTVTGSTLTANRQAVIVRGGTLQMSDTTLNLVEGFTSPNEQNYINGDWSTGNEVPQAVMTIGHDGSETAYQYKTTVTLSDVVFNAYTGATKVFVASDFANDTLVNQDDTVFAKNENGEPIKNFANITTMPIMVYLNANNLLTGSDIDFVPGWDAGTIQLVNCNDVTGIY